MYRFTHRVRVEWYYYPLKGELDGLWRFIFLAPKSLNFTKTIRICQIVSTEGQSQEPFLQPVIFYCFISHISTVPKQSLYGDCHVWMLDRLITLVASLTHAHTQTLHLCGTCCFLCAFHLCTKRSERLQSVVMWAVLHIDRRHTQCQPTHSGWLCKWSIQL